MTLNSQPSTLNFPVDKPIAMHHLSAPRSANSATAFSADAGRSFADASPFPRVANCRMKSSSGFELAAFSRVLIPAFSLRIRRQQCLKDAASAHPSLRRLVPPALLMNSRLGTSGCALFEN